MRELGFHNPPHKFVKPGYGLAVPLRKDEVFALGEMAREAGFKRLSLFCAAVLRAALPPEKRSKLVAERGAGRSHQEATSPPVVASGETGPPANGQSSANGAQGEPGTGYRTFPHETERAARRWEDVTDADERVALAKEWQVKVPLPEGFKAWEKERKLAWMNANWPLGAPEDGDGW